MRGEMEAFINHHGLRERVHLPGTRPEVATPLSAMNIFILTSEFEGTPNVVLEAQWLGLPVVATDAGGTKESFEHGVNGLLATSSSEEEIAALVVEYLADTNKTENMAILSTRFIEHTFGTGRMITETINLYGFNEAKNFC